MSINITFSYRDKAYDLLNFIDIKKYNMEMMNYTVGYIWKVGEDIINRR
ncbi:hypothetical protein CNEO4_2460005 [Clostridium neonatale]|uniref:Uncharacterized protein n=1 Tax=Clostridium neonatale TaxID=137838 RepID=A0AA86JWB7_9CLOT|nr:hypothetical protein CNEO_10029 [Clostridium neonatale]CAG9714303.1 hypothetical protein CNEO_2330006 [Clostridium neonatale]CAI3193583.1 hypothetical protein CNEO2_1280005 [Clostridium neonatale]CAI3194990.1 hypothetical protein CNEO2_1320008 [Clostridium neonatale]CAI3199872.1 hypothetical protein CNEO2_1840009 [Clostridium neonatale]